MTRKGTRKIARALGTVALTAFVVLLAACAQKTEEEKLVDSEGSGKTNDELLLKGDSTVYGLACEGCTDSVVVLLPRDGSDPVSYDIIEAHRRHRVLGKLKVGDWIGLVRNPQDSTVADLVVNLDELRGTWCYVVMPKWREAADLPPRAQARMALQMPDSVKEEFFIPREYGFTLKRQWTAQSVGYVRSSSIDEESPVVYPRLLYFTEWHILNGRLVMTSGEFRKKGDTDEMEVVNNRQDTCDIVLLTADSLVLSSDGESRGYYRRNNTADINKVARQKAAQQQKKALESR